jgi:hypothetical protein
LRITTIGQQIIDTWKEVEQKLESARASTLAETISSQTDYCNRKKRKFQVDGEGTTTTQRQYVPI